MHMAAALRRQAGRQAAQRRTALMLLQQLAPLEQATSS